MNTHRLLGLSVAVAGLLALAGCSNPLEGDWRAQDVSYGCGRDEFTADSDLKGSGTTWMVNVNGDCVACSFDFTGEDLGDDRYKIDIDFDICNCNGTTSADADCSMNSDGDVLDCDFDWGTCFVNAPNTFEKRN